MVFETKTEDTEKTFKAYFSLEDFERRRKEEEIFLQARLTTRAGSAVREGNQAVQKSLRFGQDLEEIGLLLEQVGQKVKIIAGLVENDRTPEFSEEFRRNEEHNRRSYPSFYDTQYPDLLESGKDVQEFAKEVVRSGVGDPSDLDRIKRIINETRGGIYFTANYLINADEALDSLELKKGSLPPLLQGARDDIRRALAGLKDAEDKYRYMENKRVSVKEVVEEDKKLLSAA